MRQIIQAAVAVGIFLSGSLALAAPGDVALPSVLSSHMVLQRDMPVPVWGTAKAGQEVTVTFRDQKKTATADQDGRWSLKLDKLTAGGPDKLVVQGQNTITLEDVLVGEVWVGSGQSNMDMGVESYTKDDPVLASLAAGSYPQLRLMGVPSNGWQLAEQGTINKFSALLFSFGARLQKELGVPVGLIEGAIGGTPSGAWLSPEALAADEPCQKLLAAYAEKYEGLLAKYKEEEVPKAQKAIDAAKAAGAARLPGLPPAPDIPGKVGNNLPGYLYQAKVRPVVPFAIRGVLWDQGESGTKLGGVDQYTLMGALIRGWRNEWKQDFPFLFVQKPSGGGCAWDKSNPVTNQAFPFVNQPVGVPNFGGGEYVETHIKIMKYPNTMMVTSSDLGSGIHPTNKSGYGSRSCDVALGMVYGKKVEYIGPVYDSNQVEDGGIRVKFKHTGSGLAAKHSDKLQGFAIAGEDRKWEWADAKIDGNSVVVSSEKVSKPVAVRYAYSQTHPWANLFNAEGLPAVPFRTDEW